MPLTRVECPSCGAGLKSAAGFAVGQKLRCPKCQTAFAVPGPEELPLDDLPPEEPKARPQSKPTSAKKPIRAASEVLDEEEEEDRPRKRGKKKGSGSYRTSPLRFVILGVLLVVLGVLGYFLYEKKQKEKAVANAPDSADKDDEDLGKPIVRSGNRPVASARPISVLDNPATRLQSTNNLKEIALGLLKYASAQPDGASLPLPASLGKTTGQPLLSWRVQLLPYLDQNDLYKQFKLNEPWDSDNNKKLIPRIPKVYRSPRASAGPTQTYYNLFVGGGAVFDPQNISKMTEIKDGASNTIMLIEGGEPVIWTKPQDIPYDPSKPLPTLAIPGLSPTLIAMCDGSVRSVNLQKLSEPTLRAAITRGAGDLLGADW